jgi:hypothetical protein
MEGSHRDFWSWWNAVRPLYTDWPTSPGRIVVGYKIHRRYGRLIFRNILGSSSSDMLFLGKLALIFPLVVPGTALLPLHRTIADTTKFSDSSPKCVTLKRDYASTRLLHVLFQRCLWLGWLMRQTGWSDTDYLRFCSPHWRDVLWRLSCPNYDAIAVWLCWLWDWKRHHNSRVGPHINISRAQHRHEFFCLNSLSVAVFMTRFTE